MPSASKTQEELRNESMQRFRALFETNLIGIVISDFDQKILDANDRFLDLIGYSRKELREGAITWSKITPDIYSRLDKKKIKEMLDQGTIEPFEKEYIHKSGRVVPVLVGATYINLDPPLNVSFALDVSKQYKLLKKKNEFISTVQHELRTPLAALKIQTDLLKDAVHNQAPKEELEQAVEEIDQQISLMDSLLNELWNFAQYSDSSAMQTKTLFDLNEVVAKAVENHRLVSGRKITFKGTKKPAIIRGNKTRILEVFNNLISNALQYSPKDTPVETAIRCEHRKVIASVTDHGRGIEKADQKKIFEQFYRVRSNKKYSPRSSGLGLYICKKIIANHKGRIELVSHPNDGAEFSVILPLVG